MIAPGSVHGPWTVLHQRPAGCRGGVPSYLCRCHAGHERWVSHHQLLRAAPRCGECLAAVPRPRRGRRPPSALPVELRGIAAAAQRAGVAPETYAAWVARAPAGVPPVAVPVLDLLRATQGWLATAQVASAAQRDRVVVALRLRALERAGLVERRAERQTGCSVPSHLWRAVGEAP